tara:strand:+ start:447 stop:1037 length:591 start_codon:yes stop_codon:yes gene_type:complete
MASTIYVDKVDPASGTALELGSSGDTLTVPSGATLAIASGGTLANSGTATGVGVAGTNSFSVAGSGNQTSIADDTWTKLTFDSENWDTDNCFASNKFTAPAAGKYFFTANASMYGDTDNGNSISGKFYKNGSGDAQTQSKIELAGGQNIISLCLLRCTGIFDLAQNDYIEVYVRFNTNSSTITAPASRSFMGYRVA